MSNDSINDLPFKKLRLGNSVHKPTKFLFDALLILPKLWKNPSQIEQQI